MQQHPDAEMIGMRRQVQSVWVRNTEILVMVLCFCSKRLLLQKAAH